MAGGAAGLLLLCMLSAALPEEGLTLPCPWSGGSGKLEVYIHGNPKSIHGTNGAGECRDQCMSQSTFICAAVNYKVSDGMCELLAENDQTASMGKPVDDSWQHFIRPFCAGMWLPWTAERGKYITDNSFSTLATNNLQDCMTKCLRITSGGDKCKSINIKTTSAEGDNNNCKLGSDKAGEGGITQSDNLNFQYFNRPIWYSESSTSSTSADIRYQGTIGLYLHIFTELAIPASGYLVAWQYYMNTANPCPTYASIWRPNSDASLYTLISNTLLAPEEPSTGGVRFQCIQNKSIGVRQHDVLSVHADEIGSCNTSIVSINPSEGKSTITITNHNKIDISTTRSSTTNPGLFTTPRMATPAMKAYISAYLSLEDSPQTYHNTSLSSGQIWLKLPPPLTTEESVVVAGYKIICSTDVNLSPLVPCYDRLVPVNSRDVLLNLRDVTKAYHVSVQIARNFNGVELLDDKHSPVSSSFCVGRERTDNVNISESTASDVETKPEVNVTFLHVFQPDDMCAKEIKFNYSGYDREYRIIDNNTQREYILQLEQGTTYELNIYLKLADGAEIVFWTQEYTTSSVSTPAADGGASSGGYTVTIAVAVVVPLMVLTAITILIFILYRRGTFSSSRVPPVTAEFSGGEVTRIDDGRRGLDGNIPDEYEEVSSPPAPNPNEYEEVDLPAGTNSNEYEMVGLSSSHVYEKLQVNRQAPK